MKPDRRSSGLPAGVPPRGGPSPLEGGPYGWRHFHVGDHIACPACIRVQLAEVLPGWRVSVRVLPRGIRVHHVGALLQRCRNNDCRSMLEYLTERVAAA